MSGHSHWSSIKHKKASVDSKRGKHFSKLAKAIMVAARSGPDPAFNAKLRTAIDAAKAVSMPNDKIDNAIKKGSGQLEGQTLEEVTYEAYGAGGVALYIAVITDNRNRTLPEIKKILSLKGGRLGAQNSVAWNFKRAGLITVDAKAVEEDKLLETALESGAEDASRQGDVFEILTSAESFEAAKAALVKAGIPMASAAVERIAVNPVEVDADTARKNLSLIEALEDHEDVQNVTANFTIPKEVLAELSS